MKLPRGVSADRVIRALERLGYEIGDHYFRAPPVPDS
jgi:hypothetical protein